MPIFLNTIILQKKKCLHPQWSQGVIKIKNSKTDWPSISIAFSFSFINFSFKFFHFYSSSPLPIPNLVMLKWTVWQSIFLTLFMGCTDNTLILCRTPGKQSEAEYKKVLIYIIPFFSYINNVISERCCNNLKWIGSYLENQLLSWLKPQPDTTNI